LHAVMMLPEFNNILVTYFRLLIHCRANSISVKYCVIIMPAMISILFFADNWLNMLEEKICAKYLSPALSIIGNHSLPTHSTASDPEHQR
jgi:hypothetical protein